MRNLVIALLLVSSTAFGQTVCGPYAPFARAQNPDGTWTVGTNASCEYPDPTTWAHTYTLVFPSTISYADGVTLEFVGSASAYVQGHHDRIGRAVRLVTVDAASFTDPSGNSYPVVKTEVYPQGYQYPVDQWMTTTPLAPDTTYSFAVSGTDPEYNKTNDTLTIRAIYQAQ